MKLSEDRKTLARKLIQTKVKITQVIFNERGSVTGTERKGQVGNTVGLIKCLFHPEGIPSLSVDDDKGVYNCFSCGSHGDVITLVKECEQKLHGRVLGYDKTIDLILALNPELCIELGFKSVFLHESREFKLLEDAEGNVTLDIPLHYKPSPNALESYITLAQKLRLQVAKSGWTEELQAQAVMLIACCEAGMELDWAKESMRTGVFDNSEAVPVELTEEETDVFAELFG